MATMRLAMCDPDVTAEKVEGTDTMRVTVRQGGMVVVFTLSDTTRYDSPACKFAGDVAEAVEAYIEW